MPKSIDNPLKSFFIIVDNPLKKLSDGIGYWITFRDLLMRVAHVTNKGATFLQ
jgi:hypothetical protein